ncbi:hypothetical protein EHQ76_06690 [Leptospira barantonii]|uniref:Uncharacterized protein n=1 Tax=Leptospira barantonii TaxID=2023184 RepID=A0A5F2BK59_9LEPT|nr:hypothetical protein [Leptospira barantonii]TGM05951.1 hypothetical protein EHQ76_06690 [Leptospira barantonii]
MIQFTIRGPKVKGKVYKAFYYHSEDQNGNKYIQVSSTEYGRLYFPEEIREQFKVENDTDTMTDYFDKDNFRVYETHPLFQKVAAAIEEIKEYCKRREEKKNAEKNLPKVSRCKSTRAFKREYISKVRFPESGKIVYLDRFLPKQEAIKAAQAILMVPEYANFKVVVC